MSFNKINVQYHEMSNDDYFARDELSASDIKLLLSNPYCYFHGIKKPQSKSMEFGEKVHKLVLESDLKVLNNGVKVVISPDFSPLTLKANKEAKALFEAENADNYIVTQQEYDCAESLLNSQFGGLFQEKAFVEKVYFGEIFGHKFRCKPDFFIEARGGMCIDLKTAINSSEYEFMRSAITYKYHIQAFIYSKILGIPMENFCFIVIENAYPYIASAYQMSHFKDVAEREIKKALDIFKNKELYDVPVRIHGFDNEDNPIYVKELAVPSYLMIE